jgi:hypothetical protein
VELTLIRRYWSRTFGNGDGDGTLLRVVRMVNAFAEA